MKKAREKEIIRKCMETNISVKLIMKIRIKNCHVTYLKNAKIL